MFSALCFVRCDAEEQDDHLVCESTEGFPERGGSLMSPQWIFD